MAAQSVLRRWRAVLFVAAVALTALVPGDRGGSAKASRDRCPNPVHKHDGHLSQAHAYSCGTVLWGSVQVSQDAGLGRLDRHDDLLAVLQRDEGFVALVDVTNPRRPRVVGRWGDPIPDSLDGDVAFSDDGAWVFYARQTEQFSEDGIHVLDVSDPTSPVRTSYQPQGGASRIAYLRQGDAEWVISLDAVTGLVVNRFVRPAGVLVPVHVDALPALKVGGPASAGLALVADDPAFGTTTAYVTTGRTPLQVFDLADPATPRLLTTAEVGDPGYAEVDVVVEDDSVTAFMASEYWFNSGRPPTIYEARFEASSATTSTRAPLTGDASDLWRIQGMAATKRFLYVAHSHAGLVVFDRNGGLFSADQRLGRPRPEARVIVGAPYAFDVEVDGRYVYVTDAVTGRLTVLRH